MSKKEDIPVMGVIVPATGRSLVTNMPKLGKSLMSEIKDLKEALDAVTKERDALRAQLGIAREALEAIRSYGNASAADAMDMQMMAAEALFPGKFSTPARILAALERMGSK